MSKMFPASKDGTIEVKLSIQEMIALITVLTFAKNAYSLLASQEKEGGHEESAERLSMGLSASESLLNRLIDETRVGEPQTKLLN
jgi:hypothetical protein